jgi:ligand-binding SRPBCC domain-containing protein
MKFRHAFQVQASVGQVVAFHTAAANMKAITPPVIPMRLHQTPRVLSEGDEMSFTLWLGPIPVRWVAEFEDVSASGFVDRQRQGPFRSWQHRHSFVEIAPDVTEVVDEVEAVLRPHLLWGPAGLAMWLGLPLLFAFRGWKTRCLLERESA